MLQAHSTSAHASRATAPPRHHPSAPHARWRSRVHNFRLLKSGRSAAAAKPSPATRSATEQGSTPDLAHLHAAPPPPLSEPAKRVLLAMLLRLVRQEAAEGAASPVTDQLLRARPESTGVDFMLWVAQQEAEARPGKDKEMLGALCQRLVMFRELLDQERMNALFVSTSKALLSGMEADEAQGSSDARQHSSSSSSSTAHGSVSGQEAAPAPAAPHSTPQHATAHQGAQHASSDEPSVLYASLRPFDSDAPDLGLHEHSTPGGTSSDGHSGSSARGSSRLSEEEEEEEAKENPAAAHSNVGIEGHGGLSRLEGGPQRPLQDVGVSPYSQNKSGAHTEKTGLMRAPSPLPPQLAERPAAYAVQLAEAVTGQPVVTDGYGPVYDLLLKATPPAALTAEGVTMGHQMAAELGQDLRGRRQRSVASILGRTRLTPQQANQLLAGSAASRILDLLLFFPTEEERVALLPDCFTPPPPESDDAPGQSTAQQVEEQEEGETDELWCTPAQLLSELDARVRQVTAPVDEGQQLETQKQLGVVEGQLTGMELLQALSSLRVHVHAYFMQSMSTQPEEL